MLEDDLCAEDDLFVESVLHDYMVLVGFSPHPRSEDLALTKR